MRRNSQQKYIQVISHLLAWMNNIFHSLVKICAVPDCIKLTMIKEKKKNHLTLAIVIHLYLKSNNVIT